LALRDEYRKLVQAMEPKLEVEVVFESQAVAHD
jgi:hypothetical protein